VTPALRCFSFDQGHSSTETENKSGTRINFDLGNIAKRKMKKKKEDGTEKINTENSDVSRSKGQF
jgi:hypothetical protein